MLPCSSGNYGSYEGVGYSVLTGQGTLELTPCNTTTYLHNLFFSEFRARVVTAFGGILSKILIKTKSDGMSFVLFRTNPFQILRSVISSVSVLMVHFAQVLWIGYKHLCNESVNQILRGLLIFVQHDHFVSVSNKPRFQVFGLSVSPNIPSVTNCIQAFKSMNVSHVGIVPRVHLYAT